MRRYQILYTGLRRPGVESRPGGGVRVHHTPTLSIAFRKPAPAENESAREKEDELAERLMKSHVYVSGPLAAEGLARWLGGRLREVRRDLDLWGFGKATAESARRWLRGSLRVPSRPTTQTICDDLADAGGRVVLVVGEDGRPDLRSGLEELGVEVTELRVYRTELQDNPRLRMRFRNDRSEAIVFSSPRSVDGFLLTVRHEDLRSVDSRLIAMESATAREIEAQGGTVSVDAVGRILDEVLQEWIARLEDAARRPDSDASE